ncbi:restriction endonuclease subunit S [Actinoallomurus sp. NPDC052274]|uniref:restriction endonuclease subunit S n=1 Tax=Actinoallomurus sp. NPDC052274 TaxID=3155420 RepID=UPI003426A903
MKTLIGDVPDDWNTDLLGKYCEVKAGPSGGAPGAPPRPGTGEARIPLIAPKDIGEGRIVADDITYVSEKTAVQLRNYRLEPGDVVGVRTAGIGKYALIGVEHAGWLFNTACLRIRPNQNDVHPGYLLHYLRNPLVREWIAQNSLNSTIYSINTETIRQMPLVLPPVPVQEAIGGVLSALDEKAALHAEISRRTGELRDQLSPLLLTGALPKPYEARLRGDR